MTIQPLLNFNNETGYSDRLRLQTQAQGTTQQRMLREMAEATEVMASDQPLVLVLEDLHWSDPSTLELIATIARRTESARLLILGTYRPVEMLASDHPLRTTKEELELHRHCIELRLPLLSEADVAAYLTQRFGEGKAIPRADSVRSDGGLEPIDRVAPVIHARTEGNPLFMVNIVDYLLEQGSLLDASKVEAPRNIRRMIERNLQRLTADEQRMLEAASVVGAEFSAAATAAALERPLGEVEACCTSLARREHFIRAEAASHWPDGTVAAGYRFLHDLYKEVLYERVPIGSRAELHRRIAEREEAAYGDRCNEIAAELAHHFALGGKPGRAVEYRLRACQQCAERAFYAETVAHFENGLELLPKLPDDDRRAELELDLRIASWLALAMTKGVASPEYLHSSARAAALCQRPGINWEKAWVALFSAGVAELNRNVRKACELATELVARSEAHESPQQIAQAVCQLAGFRMIAGHFDLAAEGYERAAVLFESTTNAPVPVAVLCRTGSGMNLWLLGYPDRAVNRMKSAVAFASESGSKAALLTALYVQPFFYGPYLGEFERARESAEALLALATELGDALRCASSETILGWLQGEAGDLQSGIARMRRGLSALRSMGSIAGGIPYCLALVTTALARTGQFDEAFQTVNEALELVERTGDRSGEAEVHRLKGELFLAQNTSNTAQAERCFRTAIEIARLQHGKSWELRAATSLGRLLAKQGKREEARTMLGELYNWFTEGFDTADVKDAKALLGELA